MTTTSDLIKLNKLLMKIYKETKLDPSTEAKRLLATGVSDNLAISILSIIKLEQSFVGFNNNYAGYDITSGYWKYDANLHDGYVILREGGTKICKAYVAFKNYEVFIQDFKSALTRKGFENINNGEDFAALWYKLWNGEGAGAKEAKEVTIKRGKNAWYQMYELIKKSKTA
jgi:hypothetical protein